jgi:hypothetical protein
MVAVLLAKFACVGCTNHVRVDRTQMVPSAAALSVIWEGTACRGEPGPRFLRFASAKQVDDRRGKEERGNTAYDSTYDGSHVRMRSRHASQA